LPPIRTTIGAGLRVGFWFVPAVEGAPASVRPLWVHEIKHGGLVTSFVAGHNDHGSSAPTRNAIAAFVDAVQAATRAR
jgi:hypothetical protein